MSELIIVEFNSGGIAHVGGVMSFAELERRRLAEEAYYELHAVCPKCGEGCEETCIATHLLNGEMYDSNRASCHCGWQGIVHDLVPAKQDS